MISALIEKNTMCAFRRTAARFTRPSPMHRAGDKAPYRGRAACQALSQVFQL